MRVKRVVYNLLKLEQLTRFTHYIYIYELGIKVINSPYLSVLLAYRRIYTVFFRGYRKQEKRVKACESVKSIILGECRMTGVTVRMAMCYGGILRWNDR